MKKFLECFDTGLEDGFTHAYTGRFYHGKFMQVYKFYRCGQTSFRVTLDGLIYQETYNFAYNLGFLMGWIWPQNL